MSHLQVGRNAAKWGGAKDISGPDPTSGDLSGQNQSFVCIADDPPKAAATRCGIRSCRRPT